MKKIILTLLIIFAFDCSLFNAESFSQSIYWQKYYRGFNANETSGNDIGVTNEGNFFIIGTDMVYDNSGIVIKINKYGEILNQIYIDSFSTVTCAPSSNNAFILSGSKFTSNDAIYSLKINNSGNVDWRKTYDSTPVSQIFKIILTSDNNYIGCGNFYYYTGYVIKFDTNGNKYWQKLYPAGFAKDYYSVVEGNNYYLLSGIRAETSSDIKGIITRIDTSGNIIWERDYLYNNNSLSKIIVRKLNNNLFLVAASVGGQTIERTKSVFFKIDSSGNVMNSIIELPKYENYSAFMKDCKIINENEFLFLIDNENSDSAKSSVYITDSLGNILKSNTFNYTDYILLRKAYKLNDGFIFIGNSDNYFSWRENIYVIKTDTNLYAPNPVGIIHNKTTIPHNYYLYQNFPNPFNPISKIKYQIAKTKSKYQKVQLIIYNSLGQKIKTLVNEEQEPGTYEVTFDGSNLASGVYFYRIQAGDYSNVKRMVLIK
jgi:hypothetical protein